MDKQFNFKKQPEGGLIQSKEWADFWLTEGKTVIEFNKKTDGKIFGVINRLPLVGNYIYVPRFSFQRIKGFDKNNFSREIFKKNRENKSSWMRVDLNEESDLKILKRIFGCKLVKSPHDMQPKESFIMDISLDEEELLKKMKAKTRYNIKLAKKKGVKVFSTDDPSYLKIFFDLVNKTAERKNVNFHSFSHYEKMWQSLPKDSVSLFLAEFDGKIIAANLVTFYNGVATYLHGGFDGEFRKLMAPFLLQWRCIQMAKKNNCQWYDFGGVYPNSQDEGKKGITRFKLGFSPETDFFKTKGSYDIVFSLIRYFVYRLLQKAKKWF